MYRIAIIPGDGIGKEVMESGEYLLDKLDLNFSFEYGEAGFECYNKNGDTLPEETIKIAKKSDIGFWAYSSALSFCLNCKTLMKGLNNKCPTCGESEDVEWYDRITGYVQQVGRAKSSSGGWNPGKRQELIDRRRFEDE